MTKIMHAKGLDASEFCHPLEPFAKIPRMWPFEITLEPWVGLRRKYVFVSTVARQRAESGDGTFRQGFRNHTIG
jgi:hypothetical protein